MTIAIDYTAAIHQKAGIGRLVRDLVSSLAAADTVNSYRLFAAGTRTPPASFPANFQWALTPVPAVWLARLWYRARIPLPVEFFTGRAAIFHATDFVLPPVMPGTRTIVTVHDLSFIRVPEAASSRLRAYLNAVVPGSVRRADLVLADSLATKEDLIDLYGLPSEKIRVLYSGVESRYVPLTNPELHTSILKKYNIPLAPYLFTIGTVQPRKNYARIVRALQMLRADRLDIHLVIAGQPGWLQDELYDVIESTKLGDYVHITGFVDENDVPVLYSNSQCVVYPSLYEGFGFPVLEGMACGVPVITSNVSSLPEVAGDAALLVDPYDVEGLAETIRQVLTDSQLRHELIERGFRQIKKFGWDTAAQSLIQIYNEILG